MIFVDSTEYLSENLKSWGHNSAIFTLLVIFLFRIFFTLRENNLNFCTKMTTRSKTLATLLIKSEGYMLKPRFKKGTYLRHSTCEVAF